MNGNGWKFQQDAPNIFGRPGQSDRDSSFFARTAEQNHQYAGHGGYPQHEEVHKRQVDDLKIGPGGDQHGHKCIFTDAEASDRYGQACGQEDDRYGNEIL
ncbi:hypothetical protein [Sulfuricaulis sp.]